MEQNKKQPVAMFIGYDDYMMPLISWVGEKLPVGTLLYKEPIDTPVLDRAPVIGSGQQGADQGTSFDIVAPIGSSCAPTLYPLNEPTDQQAAGSVKPWRRRMAQYVSADRLVDAIKEAADAEISELRAALDSRVQPVASPELLTEVADVLAENNWRGDLVERLRDTASAQPVAAADTDFTARIDRLSARVAKHPQLKGLAGREALILRCVDEVAPTPSAQPVAAGELPKRVSLSQAGAGCMSEDDCIAAGVSFAGYERGVSDAIDACRNIIATAYGQQCADSRPAGGVTDRDAALEEAAHACDVMDAQVDKYPAQCAAAIRAMKSQPAATLAASAAQPGAEPVGYVNGDDLDYMLDDRTATIQSARSGWRTTALYRAPVAAAVPEWISVSDRKPADGDYVLIAGCAADLSSEGKVVMWRTAGIFSEGSFIDRKARNRNRATHWMPFPPAPTIGKKGGV